MAALDLQQLNSQAFKDVSFTKMAEAVFAVAVKHGFGETDDITQMMLIVTEISEAVEADRNDKHADITAFNKEELKALADTDKLAKFMLTYEKYIKDTVEDELADAAIRLMHLAGKHKAKLYLKVLNMPERLIKRPFAHVAYNFIDTLCVYYHKSTVTISQLVGFLLSYLFEWCVSCKINLLRHIELKMLYNQARPYKHNKNY